jgi:hypothetical protein
VARSRRGRAAFPKVGVAVMVELGLHNPLAAALGTKGESEMVLAKRVGFELFPGESGIRTSSAEANEPHGWLTFSLVRHGDSGNGTRVITGLGSTSGPLTICPDADGITEVTASLGRIHKHQNHRPVDGELLTAQVERFGPG